MSMTRRNFIKNLALLGAAGAVSPLFAPAALAALPELGRMSETRLLMGTTVSITVSDPSALKMSEGLERAFSHLGGLIPIYDRHDSASLLSTLNAQGSLADCHPGLRFVLDSSLRFGALTSDAFNITILPLLAVYEKYANPTGIMPSIPAAELAEAKALLGLEAVNLSGSGVRLERAGMSLTLDGIAKGHLVDEVSAHLCALGLPNHLVNAGGDIRASGRKADGSSWQVAVENPTGAGHGPGFSLDDRAIATSGNYRNYFDASRQHHHLLNPSLAASRNTVLSASVLAPSAMEADALATAVSVLAPAEALSLINSLPGMDCLLLTADGAALTSRTWPGMA